MSWFNSLSGREDNFLILIRQSWFLSDNCCSGSFGCSLCIIGISVLLLSLVVTSGGHLERFWDAVGLSLVEGGWSTAHINILARCYLVVNG
jgi:hypothetical protein